MVTASFTGYLDIKMNNTDDDESFKFEFEGMGSLTLDTMMSCTSTNDSDRILNVSIDTQVETGDGSGRLVVTWNDSNVTSFEFGLTDGCRFYSRRCRDISSH